MIEFLKGVATFLFIIGVVATTYIGPLIWGQIFN